MDSLGSLQDRLGPYVAGVPRLVPEEPQLAHLDGHVWQFPAVCNLPPKSQISGAPAHEVREHAIPIFPPQFLIALHSCSVCTHSRISQLTELISKKPIPPHVKDLTLEVMAEDEEGEDVEVS